MTSTAVTPPVVDEFKNAFRGHPAGVAIITAAGAEGPAGYFFAGVSPALLNGVIAPVLALLSLALLAWALWSRLKLERRALVPEAEPALACTTCRPLFPSQTGTGSS